MVFTFKQCKEKWLSVYQINKAVREGKLYKLETGIYSDSPYASTLEIIVAKYPYAIITMDTAFYYHGLTDVIPDDFCIATLESAKALQDTRVRQYYIRKDLLNIGVVTMERRGVSFKIYDKERMLIELLRFKNIYPYDYYKEILSNYRKQVYELDIERIQEYADIFPKRKMISEALSTGGVLMATIAEMIREVNDEGYFDENAEAKVCQDIVLKALSESSLNRNATIKGGVVMRSISNDARRATQDMDIDFIRYSLNDDAIRIFIEKLNCLPGIQVVQIGTIEELRQQDYHGKRVYVRISDETSDSIESKIDIGVHKHLSLDQDEYCFDIACFDEGANLLINSKEQMFTEKLRSLLKFGVFSTRYKDIFDMYYLSGFLDKTKLAKCFDIFIFADNEMRENSIGDICKRVHSTFSNRQYVMRLSRSRKNWLGVNVAEVLSTIEMFLRDC